MRLQFDQILDPDRLAVAFDAPIGRYANQTCASTSAEICSQT
jgi:hypothetical protein